MSTPFYNSLQWITENKKFLVVHSNKTMMDNKTCLIKCKFIHYLKQFNSCSLQYQGASFKNTLTAIQHFIHKWDNSL